MRGLSNWEDCLLLVLNVMSLGGSTISYEAGRAEAGDPGESRFYISLEDEIMRIFGGDKIASLMTALKILGE